jgi:carbon monoxide dehydrogenase subunit G
VVVSVTRRCAAPPEAVWPWLAEPERHVQTLPDSVRDVRVLENGDVACVVSAMGANERMVVRVVEQDPPRRLVEERVDGGRRGVTIFEVAPDGDGSLVRLTSDIDLPRLLSAVAKGPVERGLAEQLANLDRLSAAGLNTGV